MQQRVELERLGDEVGRALLDRVDGVLHRAVAGDHDGDDVGVALERGVEDLPAVDAGQPQVGDQDVERKRGQPFERLLAAGRLLDEEAVVGEPLGDRLAERVSRRRRSADVSGRQSFMRADGILTPHRMRVNSRAARAAYSPPGRPLR